MNPYRRMALKKIRGLIVAASATAAGLLAAAAASAAGWNKRAFESKTIADALSAVDAASPAESAAIVINVPDIAENGAVVPIEVTSTIPRTESIFILVEKNPTPLVTRFNFANGAQGYVSTRIKMGQTSRVLAIVRADGKFYSATKEVRVTIGGCGG